MRERIRLTFLVVLSLLIDGQGAVLGRINELLVCVRVLAVGDFLFLVFMFRTELALFILTRRMTRFNGCVVLQIWLAI